MKFHVVYGSLFSIALSIFALAPCAQAEDDGQVWYQLFAQAKVTERWKLYGEIQGRYAKDLSRIDQLLVRSAINYNWPNGLSAWLGYLWVPDYYPTHGVEERLWEQLQHDYKDGDAWWIQNRLRVEQRWTPQVDASLRIRYLLRGLRQIRGGFYGVASAELFETVFRPITGGRGGFDQARLFIGPHFAVSSDVRVETGYLYNPVNRGGDPVLHNHAWVLALYWNPDLSCANNKK